MSGPCVFCGQHLDASHLFFTQHRCDAARRERVRALRAELAEARAAGLRARQARRQARRQSSEPARPLLLDLFCGEGGAAKGYHDAGFEVVGELTTIAGIVDVSQALIDQSPAQIDNIVFGDLMNDYAFQVDNQLVNGTGANNQINGLSTITPGTTVAYTSAAPKFTSATTADSFMFKVAQAVNAMWTGRKAAPEVIVMHPRRWAWILTALDSQTRPMIVPEPQTGPAAFGRMANVSPQAIVGNLQGVPVLLDQAIPTTISTNQDHVYVLRTSDMRLWESAVQAQVFNQPLANTLGVRLRVYGYVAAILNRYASSIVRISGTGLADPGL